ncbi:MAG: YfhO family protein, partial [Anaerolineae bacterium]
PPGHPGALGRPLLGLLLEGELFLASRYLDYDQATAPEAYSSLRTAVTHLLTDEGLYRVLSVSDTSFDPGDLGEIQGVFEGQLSEEAIYDYVVATKWKEVVAPNLPLHYKIATIDGYDGGILPLARYIELERLFLPLEEVSLDGRMGEHLGEIPPARFLSLMNVKYVIRDKVGDVWVDGVYYDLAHWVILGKGEEMEISEVPWFPTTSLGLVSHLVSASEVEQGTPVAEITVTDEEGKAEAYYLRAGIDTAEGRYEEGVRHQRGRVVRRDEESDEYHAWVRLREPLIPQRIEVRYLLPCGEFHLRGLTLVEGRTGAHRSLVVSPAYRLVHSGDVKIYENMENLPRAFVVHRARISENALEAMKEEAFDPGREVILSQGPGGHLEEGKAQDRVSMVSYQPERVEVQAHLGAPGYLVLTDAYYPGWKALVDGRTAKIERADYYFRAVYLEEGEHTIEFVYAPLSFKVGVAISLASLALVIIGLERR